jgi:6-phosphogluconolactonase (cycloisomerase 2 family)
LRRTSTSPQRRRERGEYAEKTGYFHAFSIITVIGITFLFLSVIGNVAGQGFEEGGAVYVLANQGAGNTVVVFDRAKDGKLTRAQEVGTQGLGSGSGLGSQGALTLGSDGHLLFAVNAGSNTVSVLAVTEDGVRFVDQIASGGTRPISITAHSDLVYVLNAGGSSPNITGFSLSPTGKLTTLPNSTRALAGGAKAAPAQVSFTPDGELLLVTEKGTGLIDVFTVGEDGRADSHTTQTSNNATPFGFGFRGSRVAVVSEAAGGAPGGSTVSTYRIGEEEDEDGQATLTTISKSVPDTQTAACWIVVTRDGRFAFTSNTGSGTISSYTVSTGGTLLLKAAVAGDLGAGSGPIDMALSRDGHLLFVLKSGSGAVTSLAAREGILTEQDSEAVPTSSTGIAAR